MEEEGTDRLGSIALPGQQLALIKAVHAVGKPLVAITIHGGPVSEPFLANAPQLAWVWSSYYGTHAQLNLDFLLPQHAQLLIRAWNPSRLFSCVFS